MALELTAQAREITGKKVRQLRNTGEIPAVLYGHNIKPLNLSVSSRDFDKIFGEAGETSLVSLALGGKKHNVLIHDFERDPLSGDVLHVDFYEVKMDEKIKTKVQLKFIGESAAVKSEGGILIHALSEVEVEALPQDLPKEILADISVLAAFGDKIKISDLKVSSGVKILAQEEEIVATVTPPRSDKELADLEEKPQEEVGEIKVVGEEKKAAEAAEKAAEESAPKA